MKNRIYIIYPAEMNERNIQFMERIISKEFHGRTKLDDYMAYIDLIPNDNTDKDEVSQFILELDGTDFGTYWGKPLDDDSNSTDNIEFKDIYISEIK